MSVRPSAAAADDLGEIVAYVSARSQSAAERILDAVEEALGQIDKAPGAGHVRGELPAGLRCWVVYSNVIIYKPATREVARILHGARDLGALFESE
ncbi:Plasmid stabilization system protein [Phycisphaerae bacterium RAS1]|nr:Plasmid stabilization system protein [Phycisphaerae bacterium RAS1]